jgi:hypothetical protein
MPRTIVGLLLLGLVIAGCGAPPQARGNPTPVALSTQSPTPNPTPSATPTATASPSPAASPSADPSPSGACLGGATGAGPAATSLPAASTGSIAGHTTSGAEVLFPQLVYAISTAGASHGAYSVETNWSQSNFTIKGIPPGSYYVYAINRPPQPSSHGCAQGALYSYAVKCGLDVSCTNHKPLRVTVKAGVTAANIDPDDEFSNDPIPAPPSWIVPPTPRIPPAAKGYASARAAAVAGSASQTTLVVDSMATCPVNRACTAVGVEHDGTQAAYFIGVAGSNQNLIACGFYVIHVQAGWQPLSGDCGRPTIFPAVGHTGPVQLGFENPPVCGNVRTLPGPTGKVVACLADGTQVRLDSGPAYVPMATTNGLWWHIAGRGWMVDDFLGHHFVGP